MGSVQIRNGALIRRILINICNFYICNRKGSIFSPHMQQIKNNGLICTGSRYYRKKSFVRGKNTETL